MKKTLPSMVLLTCLFFNATLFGQNLIDNKGTEFWLMFNENVKIGELQFFISAESNTSGMIDISGINFSQSFTVEPGEITTINVPDEAIVTTQNGISNKGIHITSQNEISVYGLNQAPNTSDAYMALPVDALGMEYLIMAYHRLEGSSFGAVATQDNTTVTVTVKNGNPFTINLNAGEVYQGSSPTNSSLDYTGTEVVANKPVAVFGGNECANVPPSTAACDHLVEQMPPVSTWGRQFLTIPLATREKGDVFRVLAAKNGTSVTIDNQEVAVLNKGEFFEGVLTTASEIRANEPILVAQYSPGTLFDNVTSDPFMVLVPPFEQYSDATTIATPSANNFSIHFLNIIVNNLDVNSVQLDGNTLPSSEFTRVGQSNFSTASIEVNPGTHSVSANLPLGVYVYGFGFADSYGYLGGQIFSEVARARNISLNLANDTIPTNSEGCLMAGLSDEDNSPLVGVRLDIGITGANPQNSFEFTNQNGEIEFCYDAVNEGVDNITISLGIDNLSQTTIRTVGCYDTNKNGIDDCEEILPPPPPPMPDCPVLQKNINDSCDDGNSETENDKVTNNCECKGTPKDMPPPPPPPTSCQGTITPMASGFALNGFNLKHNTIIVFDRGFSNTFAEINYETNFRGDTIITGLPVGDYAIKVQIFNEQWQLNCNEILYLSITESGTIEPPSNSLCDGVSVSGAYGTMTVGNLGNTPKEVALLAENGYVIFSCSSDCGPYQQYEGLAAGNYTVRVTFYDYNWQLKCQKLIPYSLANGATSRDNGGLIPEDLRLAPNPAGDYTEIDLFRLQGQAVQLMLTDKLGRILYQKELPKVIQSFERIDTKSFPNGLYFLQIKAPNKPMISKKLLINRMY